MAGSERAAYRGSLCVIVLGLLAACGGGSDSPPSSPPPSQPSVSGLIPAAPAVGAVLYSDASTLRPVQSGAVWTYAGTVTNPTSGETPTYTDVLTQTSTGTGSATESFSNQFEGGIDTDTLTVSPTLVSSNDPSNNIIPGVTGTEPWTELRAPVRQNDQYTLLDEAKADLGMDLDGDGIDEQADIGIYRKVIGNDSVTLPGRGATTALRVDMVALVRAYASKTGEATPLIQITQSNWYAPGIGLVRIQLTGPDNLGASEVYDEILASVTGIPTAVEASATQAHPSTAAAEAVAHAQGVGARMIAAAARAAIASAH